MLIVATVKNQVISRTIVYFAHRGYPNFPLSLGTGEKTMENSVDFKGHLSYTTIVVT